LGYGTKSGHGYGNQSRRGASRSFGRGKSQRKERNTMNTGFRMGQTFCLTSDAEENYRDLLEEKFGKDWQGRTFKVTNVARNSDEHPGYDEGVSPQKLYDFKDVKTGEDMPISIYDWEIT
jgi:hypothetical protein